MISCAAGGMTAVAVGCSDLLGDIGLRTTEQGVEALQLRLFMTELQTEECAS
jgi:hypothetical protein